MVDVRNLVKGAEAAHEEEKARRAQAYASENAPRLARVDASIATLNGKLKQILASVAQDLGTNGIETEFVEKFDVKNRSVFAAPAIELRLLGPVRLSDGYRFKSPIIFFLADGETVTATHSIEKHASSAEKTVGSAKGDEIDALVERTLASALPLYFEKMDEWKMVSQI
jgi:hypothetical protein